MGYNVWSDVSGIAQSIQEKAYLVVREIGIMQSLVTVYRDATGMNTRKSYKYNSTTAKDVTDADDLTSTSFTPSEDQTLTPSEIGDQYFISDARQESELPEDIMNDAARNLGLSALDKVESGLLGLMSSLTGGTVGTAHTAITWGWVAAAIAQARNANKSTSVPLACVLHGYQWSVLAKAASIAGTSLAQAPGFTEEMSRTGYVGHFMGVPMYQVYASPNSVDDFYGGVFPKSAIALDWRRAVRIEGERDASRRGVEMNMSAIYAKGVWRPELGVQILADATAPES
jgi:hypothetical protein